jgi:hypothetical protein
MIGTGFIKCIPITLSALFVAAAILVIEIEEVLVARYSFQEQIHPSVRKFSALIPDFP